MLLLDNISNQNIEVNTVDPLSNKIQLSDINYFFPYLYFICGGSKLFVQIYCTCRSKYTYTFIMHLHWGLFFTVFITLSSIYGFF